MPVIPETIRPTIHILCAPNGSPEILKQIQYGIEEEGIPWETNMGEGDAISLAWKASQDSRLEVGVGLDDQTAVLQFSKLKREKPLFSVSVRSTPETFRGLGANAGRLVKKQPLKILNGR